MEQIKGIEILENVSLKNYNTYKIEAKTKYLIKIENIEALEELLKYLKNHKIKYLVLGNGSNVVLDDYFDGAIIKLTGLNKIRVNEEVVEAEAGAMMSSLAMMSVQNNLTGLEWAINIPGTIGGSIKGNAGAYNSAIMDNLVDVKVLTKDLNLEIISKKDIDYGYRYTNLKDVIILGATFKLSEGKKEESLKIMQDRIARREATQPLDMPSCGSVFRNPLNDHAGRLIEAAGLKGKTIGGAMVSEKHANFIVNIGNATSKDIKSLIKLVREEVKKQFDVELILEQEIMDWS